VSDTGPLLHLAEAGALHIVRLAGELHIPSFVFVELTHYLSDQQVPAWIQIDTLLPSAVAEAAAGAVREGEGEWARGRVGDKSLRHSRNSWRKSCGTIKA
jgi:predicted nucleic acid-binding protein